MQFCVTKLATTEVGPLSNILLNPEPMNNFQSTLRP